MSLTAPPLRVHPHWAAYTLALMLIATVYSLYGINIVRWRNSPDFGWRTMVESGPNVVTEVFARGAAGGLRVNDAIRAINGRTYTTFDELLFTDLRSDAPGSVNVYSVTRDGQTVEIEIVTGRLGLREVLWRSGPLFVIGLFYVFIGALVFSMKPRARESWLFLVMTSLTGATVSYEAPAYLLRPTLLYDLRFLLEVILPAPMIHLALRFPKTRRFLRSTPSLTLLAYLPPLLMFAVMKATSTGPWNIPRALSLAQQFYLVLGVLVFVLSMAWNAVRDPSLPIRRQSQMILIGTVLGFLIPTIDLISRLLWNVYLFPDPALGFGLFLSLFPLSIGYTIIKHDLFAIDTIVRRTYGYVLSTASIIASYAVLVSALNVTFQGSEVSRSPLFSLGFALAVVFLFQPLHRRFQRMVDRVFYRQRYDYRQTIKSISEAITSILDATVIHRTLVDAVVREMFLENGVLLLADRARQDYAVVVTQGIDPPSLVPMRLATNQEILRVMQEKSEPILRYDVDLHPRYEQSRDILRGTFDAFKSDLMIPMSYKGDIRGIMSLGRKKSGKAFTLEDLDLLKTIINQSVIALENAELFRENLEKGRLEEELKIAHEIQTSMLPDTAPAIPGYQIAASSIPAREVGGDFYDFIEIRGQGAGESLGIVVGDVSGKAVSGALVMAAARSILRVLAETHPAVEQLMCIANARLHRDIRKGMFVALVYALLDPRQKTLTLVNAGQTQPILSPGHKAAPSYIDTDGDRFPLGIIGDCEYRATEVPLRTGDTIVFYTDGVVEAMNEKGELYGFDRLMRSVHEGRDPDAAALLAKLTQDISRHVGDVEQHDDLTMVVLKVA